MRCIFKKWFKVLQDLTNKSAKIEMEQDEGEFFVPDKFLIFKTPP